MLGSEVVRVQVEHPHHERHKDGDEDHHELEDVLHRPPQRDLQGSESFVGRQDVGDAGEAQHHGDGVEAFGDELRV